LPETSSHYSDGARRSVLDLDAQLAQAHQRRPAIAPGENERASSVLGHRGKQRIPVCDGFVARHANPARSRRAGVIVAADSGGMVVVRDLTLRPQRLP